MDFNGEDITSGVASEDVSINNKTASATDNTINFTYDLGLDYITLRNLQYLKIDNLLTVDSSNIHTSSTVTFYRDETAIYSFDFTFNASESDSTRVSDASFVFIGPEYAATYVNDPAFVNYKKVILNNNVGSTTPTITDNKLNNVDIDVAYNEPLTINYDVSYSNFDFSSLVIYPGGILTSDTARLASLYGAEVEFLLHDAVQYKHKIYDISVNGLTAKAYRFDGSGNKNFYDGSDISFNDFVEYYSQNYIIDNYNIVDGEKAVQVISTIPNIQSYTLNGIVPGNDKSLNSITYGEVNGSGVYVAVGNKVILSSKNGLDWKGTSFKTQDTIYIDNGTPILGYDQNWVSVAFGNGKFVAVAPDNNAYYSDISSNSSTGLEIWQQYSNFLISDVNFRSITFGNNKFAVVSAGGTFNIVSISDGSEVGPFFDDVITSNPYVSISFGKNQFVAIDNNEVQVSSDAKAWIRVYDNNFIDSSWNSLRFLNNQFLAVSNSGTKKLAYVNDPTSSWNNLRIKPGIWNDIAYGNDNYVIVGNSENDNSVGALLINDGVLNNSVVLGNTSEANYHNSLVLGNNSHSENENQIILGNANHFVGIRQPDPVFPLDVSGNINFTGQLLQNSSENIGIKTNIPRVTLDVSANDAIIIPVGTTSQRPNYDADAPNSNGIVGAIRYNIETDQFEGFGTPFDGDFLTGGYWGSLGGVKDIDGDTYITAQEDSNDDDILRFINDGNTNMIIDASGRVGIGTDVTKGQLDASASLHVFGNSRIEGSLSLGTKYPEGGNNATDFAKIYMDTGDNTTDLVIETSNDDIRFKTGNNERMIILGNGNIGVGTTDPSATFHVLGDSRIEGSLFLGTKYPEGYNDESDFAKIYMDTDDNTTDLVIETSNESNDDIRFKTGNYERMIILGNGKVGIGSTTPDRNLYVTGNFYATTTIEAGTGMYAQTFNASSDIRLKNNVESIENPLSKISKIQGVKYVLNSDDTNKKQIGFIAQDIEKIIPEVVYTDNSEEAYKSISYGNLTALLVEGIKELQKEVNSLREEIKFLKK